MVMAHLMLFGVQLGEGLYTRPVNADIVGKDLE
jgi:hypothetical protein